MKNSEFLTVKEVAEYAGVSVQAIYNQLEKNFKPYLKIVNGKKCLDIEVLRLFDTPKVSTDFKENFKDILNLLERQNEQMNGELQAKNKQIDNLTSELQTKNKQIDELNARLAEITSALNASQETLKGAQALHAGTLQQLTAEEKPSEDVGKNKKHWWQKKNKE